jgi:hypothetical protein
MRIVRASAAVLLACGLLALLWVLSDGGRSVQNPHIQDAESRDENERTGMPQGTSTDLDLADGTSAREGLPLDPPAPAGLGARAVLSFLWALDGEPAAGTLWRLQAIEARSQSEVRFEGSPVELSPGRWTVESSDGSIRPLRPAVDLAEGDAEVIWCTRIASLECVVEGPAGEPIEHAAVEWRLPQSVRQTLLVEFDSARALSGSYSTRTDENGKAVLDGISGLELGELFVAADGYMPHRSKLDRRPEGPMRIRLDACEGEDVARLRIVDLAGAPMPAVFIRSGGLLLGSSDEIGELTIPSEIVRSRELTLDGACFPCRMLPEALEGATGPWILGVPRRVGGTIGVHPAQSVGVLVLLRSAAHAGERLGFDVFREERLRLSPEGTAPLDLPAGVPVRVQAVDEEGRTGEITLVEQEEGWRADIDLQRGKELIVRATLHGSPVSAIWGEVIRGSSDRPVGLVSVNDGALHVPAPGEVLLIVIRAQGLADIQLAPHGFSDRAGELVVNMLPRHRVEFLVRSEDGHTLPGVGISADPMRSGVAAHPDRHGGWPSGHPGWTLRRERMQFAWTDAAGRAVLRLTEGEHEIASNSAVPWRTVLTQGLAGGRRRITVQQDQTIELLASRPRRLALEVLDGATSLQVPGFSIVEGEFGEPQVVSGNHWDGWVGSATSLLTVIGPAGSRGSVLLPVGWEPVERTVVLEPGPGMDVLVRSPIGVPISGRLTCTAFHRTRVHGDLLLGSFESDVDAEGRTSLFVPYESGVILNLAFRSPDGLTLVVEPAELAWARGTTASLVVRVP